MINSRLINTKVAGGGGGCTDIVDNYDPFGDSSGLALWQLNGNATDVSGNYNGTWSGTETYTTGVFGQAANFNGGSYISTTGNISGGQDFTISLWVNPATNTNIQNSLFTMGSTSNNGFFIYRYNQQIAIDSFGTTRWTVEGFFTENAWQHLTITHSSGTNNVYLNGSFYATFSYTWNINSSATTYIGAQIAGFSRYLTGSLDQVRIFNAALTPLEIEALYTEELCICDGTVDTLDILGDGSCIATYQLDGNANDLSGNYSGTPTDVSYGVGEFDLAGVFNGSSSYIDTNSVLLGSVNYSVSMWINPNSIPTTTTKTLYTQYADAASGRHTVEFGQNFVKVFINPSGSTNLTTTWATNTWFHIVVTKNSTGFEVYVNNSSIGTISTTNTVGSFDTQIGGDEQLSVANQSSFDGSIDQVRIFNKALNSTEVTTLYNETACASKINLDRDPVRHWGLDNTLASTKSGYSALQKTSATYSTGRFGAALNFNRGETASETSTFYGDIWTDVTKANFLQGSVSFWFKPASTNQRNIVTYCEKIPPFGLEFSTGNKLSITSFLDTNTYSPETYGTSDIIFVCINAVRVGGVGSTQTCDFTMYYSSVSENNLKSITSTGTSTESTYTTTFCLGHGASSVGFNGWVDQFRLFDKPLNAEQVQALFDEAPY